MNVHLNSGRSFWIDQGATIFVPDKIINTDNANYGVIINQSNRVDGIYTDPYNTTTNSQSPIEFGSAYDG
ncbi:MAG: GW dipeptide domain-containing protein [Weissella confusa]